MSLRERTRPGPYTREAVTRLVGCAVWLMAISQSGAQTDPPAPSDPQAYCVNRGGDFYPYTGDPCKTGYQLGPGNCRKADGRMVAVAKEQCVAMGGLIALPFEGEPPEK
jgi:hypothetical protein